MTIEQRQQAIIERAKAQQEARLIARLETPAGERDFLVDQDKALLNSIKARLETAYGKQLPTGFKFNDIVETIVFLATIASMAFYTYKAGQASAFIQAMELKYKEKEKENE